MDNGETTKIIKKITVFGIVQGVGFRPLVYHIAKKHNILGTVKNIGGVVEIIAKATSSDYSAFLEELIHGKQGAYEIHKLIEEEINPFYNNTNQLPIINVNGEFITLNDILLDSTFRIIDSEDSNQISMLPPDLSICKTCEKELLDKSNRRYYNPFISCTSCGPRYTIVKSFPYDRCNTTMDEYSMCNQCNEEYSSPGNRRHHAQTISCHDCGPYLIWYNSSDTYRNTILLNNNEGQNIHSNHITRDKALQEAIQKIKSGAIIAVKGIGGYHFVCSPIHETTVNNLRLLKGREEKPFAVMFPNIESIKGHCIVSEKEKALLTSTAKPIVLLKEKKSLFAPSTNKHSVYCGSFLPYTPLQLLLTKECGPLIMTSANRSNQPIIIKDDDMLSLHSEYLSGVLYHTREILRPVEDSVVMVVNEKPVFIRRSRGYVPYPIYMNSSCDRAVNHKVVDSIEFLALGADLKATFSLYQNGTSILSPYFGDLEEMSIIDTFKEAIQDMCELFRIKPPFVVCDMHPNYYSVRYAKEQGLPLLQIQHHHAHIASVMAEHNLYEKVIGIAFDGTGYGTDGNVWGGEFLICEGTDFTRNAHLNYVPLLGGDESMKDSKKSATCMLRHYGLDDYIKDERAPLIRAALDNNFNTFLSSSMGRLFDAVSSILGICDYSKYEGESSILLEQAALQCELEKELLSPLAFSYIEEDTTIQIDPSPILSGLCKLRDAKDTSTLALGFHYAVADMIVAICKKIRDTENTYTVALSGGVFQNRILLKETVKQLEQHNFMVYHNTIVPPNDGGISLGQTYLGRLHHSPKI